MSPLVAFGAAQAADFDGDGDMDVFVTGEREDGTIVSGLFRFDTRQVTQLINSSPKITAIHSKVEFPIRPVTRGSVQWVDVNGDDRPDLIVTGRSLESVTTQNQVFRPAADVYINIDGSTMALRGSLTGVEHGATATGDFDGDGNMDIILGGITDDGPILELWINNNNFGSFHRSVNSSLDGIWPSALTTADYDLDGKIDVLVSGFDASDAPRTILYRNTGSLQFEAVDANLPQRLFSSASFGDVDSDGDPDLYLSGGTLGPTLLRGEAGLYRNNGGVFSRFPGEMTGLFFGGSSWADFDSDGDIDLLVYGQENLTDVESQRIIVYNNSGDSLNSFASFRGVQFGDVFWDDYQGDGRLDVLIAGIQNDRIVINLFEL